MAKIRLYPYRKYTLLIIVFLMPFQNLALFGNAYLFLPMVGFLIYFVLVVATDPLNLLLRKSTLVFLLPMIMLWILIFIMNQIYYMPGDISAIGASYLRRFATFMIFYLLLINETRFENTLFERMPKIYIYSMLTIFVAFQLGIDVNYISGRLVMFGTNSNTLGFFSLIAALFSLSYLFNDTIKKWYKVFYGFSHFLFVFLIGQTASRGAIYSLVTGYVIFFVFLQKPILTKIKLLIPGLILVGLMIFLLLNTGVVKERLMSENERGDFGSRKPIWEISWSVVKDNLVFGLGPSRFDYETTQIIGRYRSQHNEYLKIIGYSGFVGLSLLLLFIYELFNSIRLNIKNSELKNSEILLSLLAATATFMFVGGNAFMTFIAWFIFAYASSFAFIPKQKALHAKTQQGVNGIGIK